MNKIGKLIPGFGAPVFDREAMLREVLAAKVNEWLNGRHFYVNDLATMREIAHDILGLDEGEPRKALSPDLERLHCMAFETLTPVNLKECLHLSLKYIGITKLTGADVFGATAWAALQECVDSICSSSVNAEVNADPWSKGELPPFSDWEQHTLFTGMMGLFEKEYFDICIVSKLGEALNDIRRARGLPQHKYSETTAYVVLSTLHCVKYSKMVERVRCGIKGAVWSVLDLDLQIGRFVFGDERWAQIDAMEVYIGVKAEAVGNDLMQDQPRWRWSKKLCLALALLGIGLVFGAFFGKLHATRNTSTSGAYWQTPNLKQSVVPMEPPSIPMAPSPVELVEKP